MQSFEVKSWEVLENVKFQHDGEELFLQVGEYSNGRVAVQLFANTGPYCTLTVNIYNSPCGIDQFYVKVGGIEEIIAQRLADVKLIQPTNTYADSGFVKNYARLWEIVSKDSEEDDKVTSEHVIIVADRHINRFRSMIEAASKGANRIKVNECKYYLNIWESIKSKGGHNLTNTEHYELRDAVVDGEFDEF